MWMKRLLSFLFPPTCVICGAEGAVLCMTCEMRLPKRPLRVAHDTWALFPYHHPTAGRMIQAMKFEGRTALADVSGKLLLRALDGLFDAPRKDTIIVPIPSSPLEHRSRGYDHINLIAESLGAESNITILPALLKIRETKRQVETKNRAERMENLEEAFHASDLTQLAEKTFIVIDDVTTTGATFMEAKRALEIAGAKKVVCLALAH
jgi:ComF family protein